MLFVYAIYKKEAKFKIPLGDVHLKEQLAGSFFVLIRFLFLFFPALLILKQKIHYKSFSTTKPVFQWELYAPLEITKQQYLN